ncbi:hypothetical protein K438DRAFT_1869531 [Mycena galopus ATCC 62051]|nr:hypothetical protein K438DRAFT_1869531 [Mycena galopus ATCC 62051]
MLRLQLYSPKYRRPPKLKSLADRRFNNYDLVPRFVEIKQRDQIARYKLPQKSAATRQSQL